MPEDTLESTLPEAGVAAEQAASQEPSSPSPEAEGQESGQPSAVSKPPVEPIASEKSSNGVQRRLPSHFYNARKMDAVTSRLDEYGRVQSQILEMLKNRPSAPPAQPSNPQNSDGELLKSFYDNPVAVVKKLIEETIKNGSSSTKQEIIGEFEKREQERQFETALQETDRLVLTNERAKTNPNFKDDIIAIMNRYKSIQTLAVKDPVSATMEAFEIYDSLIGGKVPKVPMPRKGGMGSTQTGVRANGSNSEEALLAELENITKNLNHTNASDPKTIQRIDEIGKALDQLK